MKKTSYIVRLAVGLTLTLLVSNSVFCQDTVRMNDNRFIYPQLPSKDFYFSRMERTSSVSMSMHNGYNPESFGYECFLDKDSATIYGIAIAISCVGEYPWLWDYEHNKIWLKIMDTIPENGSGIVLDSVRITEDSEQKILILDEIITTLDGVLTDSIGQFPQTLYCGYFGRPLQINDRSFFVQAHIKTGYLVIPAYNIHPDITSYYYDGYSHYWFRDSIYTNLWLPLLPIVVPPPGWTPDPEDPEDPENPGGDEGIGEVVGSQQSAVSIYPNPASGYAVVTCDAEIRELTLCDVNGRLLLSMRNCGGSAKVDTSVLAPGVYMLRVTTDAGTATRKLAVEP